MKRNMQCYWMMPSGQNQIVLIKKERFGGQSERASLLVPAEIDAESALMQSLAEVTVEEEEDKYLDDGEIEIQSEEEYIE